MIDTSNIVGPLELAANLLTTASILLAGRNSMHTWWTGIIGCSLFALLFYQSQLYADVTLQAFFIGASVIGWWQWRGGAGAGAKPLAVTASTLSDMGWTVPAGVVATAIYGALLHHFTDAYAPFVDSAVLVFSVIAQVLMIRRRIASWPFWLLVNSIAIPLYFSRGLYLTAFLYGVYWINALVSWRWWRRLANASAVPAASLP